MKRTIKLALSASLLLGATSAFATNGDVMIGQGAKSRSMGGVGIAKSFGAESALANPAMISSVKNMEVTAAVTFFMPSVSFESDALANSNPLLPTGPVADSAADFSVIPEIYFAQRINDNLVYGISVAGTAGMGTDYSDTAFDMATGKAGNGSFQMKTELQLLKVAIPIAYTMSGATIGIAPILQYGSLGMSHQRQTSATTFGLLDNGTATDINYGYELGLSYDFKEAGVNGLTLGLVYKSAIAMTYDNVIGASLQAFQVDSQITSGDSLDQPAEFGFGLAYEISGSTIAFDYKNIAWGDAAGYADFGWENQDVIALGYEYATSSWALRAGYNYAKSPIAEQVASASTAAASPTTQVNYAGAIKNFFNLAGFPGIVESHMTFGGGYNFSEALSLDASVVYVPEVSLSYDTSAMTGAFINASGTAAPATELSTADVTHSQLGVTIAMTYAF